MLVSSLIIQAQTKGPQTAREFFNLLPQKYFSLEGCDKKIDRNCNRARAKYLESYLEVEDNTNGFMKGGCDGAQSCFSLALFKRPDKTYILGLHTTYEAGENSYFLEYKKGKWRDVSKQIVPNYDAMKIYELPHYGTIITVYQKKLMAGETEFFERGKHLYNLAWARDKFIIQR